MVQLSQAQIDAITRHAQEQPDEEVCGVLGGRTNRVESVHRARNVAEMRRTRFEMDSRDIFSSIRAIESAGMELIGFYHSHTHTQAYPSPTDVAMWTATWGTDALCFICSLMEPDRPVLRAFWIDDAGSISEEPITVDG
ncbi:MAG TPA: M67 family metallopeptidase [Chloroflexota bacterium]|nr:M67 family metallopeptidase [Chloroflexota bacterium]